jgi:hypothetical protein
MEIPGEEKATKAKIENTRMAGGDNFCCRGGNPYPLVHG